MKAIFKQSIDLFGKENVKKGSKSGKGRYYSPGEKHHFPDRPQADRTGNCTLQEDKVSG
jgi:hypothetical protein